MARIAGRHFHEGRLLTALGNREEHFRTVGAGKLLGEPFADDLFVFRDLVDDKLMRNRLGGAVIAQNEHAQKLGSGNVLALVEHELVGVHDAALAQHQNGDAGNRLLAVHADNVGVQPVRGNRMLGLGKGLDGVDAALDAPCTLEIKLLGSLGHLAFQLVDELLVRTGQEPLDLAHLLLIRFRRDAPAAGAGAQADMAIETRALIELHLRIRLLLQLAVQATPLGAGRRADGHDASHDVDQIARRTAVGVGAEVTCGCLMGLARVLDGGKHVSFGKGDERIALIVLEVGIEIRGVLLDEIALENKALMLIGRNHVLEGVDLRHQQGNLRAIVLEVDVLAHACAQLLGLSHVDYRARLVFPKVHAWLGGHAVKLLFDLLKLFLIHERP